MLLSEYIRKRIDEYLNDPKNYDMLFNYEIIIDLKIHEIM
jgi:hypothetical protein